MTGYLPRERISAPIMEIDLMNMQVQDFRRGAMSRTASTLVGFKKFSFRFWPFADMRADDSKTNAFAAPQDHAF